MGKTGLVFHPAFLEHDMGTGHPESPGRLRAIMRQLEQSGTLMRMTRVEPRKAEDEWITQVHTSSYVASLNRHAPSSGRVSLDPDTSMSPGSLTAAYLAAGGVLAGVDAIMAGQVDHVFCAVRPPGHHAEAGRAMGFCLFNNVAIAARYVQKKYGLSRVLIVDWDVHHGDGTEDIFRDDGRVMLCSTFRHPYFPYCGADSGNAHIINVPLAAGATGEQFQAAVTEHWLPALEKFQPELILISAGFDAHREDDMGGLALRESDYEWVTLQLKQLAARHAQRRMVSLLEGGYALNALGRSAVAHIKVLSGL